MASFPGVDYMDIDSLFSEDELMVRQTVRDFVDDEVIPIIEHANREEKFPAQLIPKMAEMGLFGATILWVLYAAVSGRGIKQRLTDPAPLDRVPDNLVKA